MKIICIIPARYSSTRFPGKPLADISGYPMISWVYHRAKSVVEFDDVIVATDNDKIYDCVQNFGGKVLMTPDNLKSGTDRVAFIAKGIDAEVFVNLQGDEPLIAPEILSQVCRAFEDKNVKMATPVKKVKSAKELDNKNAAWVVKDNNNDAIYFSRAVIPVVHRQENKEKWIESTKYYKHVGIYAYRKEFLLKLTKLPRTQLEKAESLEQLRVLENGFKIRCVETEYQSINVDIPEDVEKVLKAIRKDNIKLEQQNA